MTIFDLAKRAVQMYLTHPTKLNARDVNSHITVWTTLLLLINWLTAGFLQNLLNSALDTLNGAMGQSSSSSVDEEDDQADSDGEPEDSEESRAPKKKASARNVKRGKKRGGAPSAEE